MPRANTQTAAAHAARGYFGRALDELGPMLDRLGDYSPAERALLAEVLERCGRNLDAEAVATELAQSVGADAESRARAILVLGHTTCSAGLITDAVQHHASALRLALASSNERLASLAYLSALETVAAHLPRPALLAHIADARRCLMRAAEPLLTARFHYHVAKFEAFNGNLTAARRHLDTARHMFDADQQEWLAGRIAFADAALCFFDADYERGLTLAEQAVRFTERTGHSINSLEARGTVCWFQFKVGRFEEARGRLIGILNEDPPLTERLLLLDTMIEVLLAQGRPRDAEAIAAEASEVRNSLPSPGKTFFSTEVLGSQVKLLLETKNWVSAEALARHAADLTDARRYPLQTARFRLQLAEALVQERNTSEEVTQALLSARLIEDLPIGHRALLDRVLGVLFASQGHHARADRHFRRAMRVFTCATDVAGALETERTYEHWIRERGTTESAASGLQERQVGGFGDALERTAALMHLAGHAELLARECVELLEDAQAARKLALVATTENEAPDILTCRGWDPSALKGSVPEQDGVVLLPAGTHAGRQFDVLVEPEEDPLSRFTVFAVTRLVDAALALDRYRREEKERESLWPQEDMAAGEAGEVFASTEMTDLLATARRVAPTTLPILLTGETGTGKEVLARLIHRTSPRAAKPFLAFNCAAVPRDMLESQLFGYRRGAFTGAQEPFAGVIRAADGGTLFLDEIGEVPVDVQPKLLRFLETREIHPLGEPRPVTVDVRIIAATNADLDRLVGDGRFRDDLLYRLNVIHFRLPPLRQRREEIPALVHHFLLRFGQELDKGRPRISEETMEYLLLYAWPGNVRQLSNEIRRAVALAGPDGTLTPEDLSPDLRASRRTLPADATPRADELLIQTDQPLATVLNRVERLMITRALDRSGGRLEDAARRLGVSRKGLFMKRQRLGLVPPAPDV